MRFLVSVAFASLVPITALAEEIVPLDGDWTTQVKAVSLTQACPDTTRAAILPQLEQSVGQSSTTTIQFGGDFDPNLLEEGNRPYGWVQKDDNLWEGAMLSDGDDKEIGTATLTVENDALISVQSEVELAQMLNPSQDPNLATMFPSGCQALLNIEIAHSG